MSIERIDRYEEDGSLCKYSDYQKLEAKLAEANESIIRQHNLYIATEMKLSKERSRVAKLAECQPNLLKSMAMDWINNNVHDGQDRIGCKNDWVKHTPDELQELIDEMLDDILPPQTEEK